MHLPPIYPILDTAALAARGIGVLRAAEAFLEAGARILQYRHKAFFSRDNYAQAQLAARLCLEAGALFVMNDRADYARLLGAALHIGQDDLSPSDARTVLGPDALLGFSTHNAAQMRAAQSEPVDYLAFGPVFPTASKANPDPTTGIETLRLVRTLTHKPLVAIGGITLDNAAACFEAGADSLSVISALLSQEPSKNALRARMTEWLQLSVMLHRWPRPLP